MVCRVWFKKGDERSFCFSGFVGDSEKELWGNTDISEMIVSKVSSEKEASTWGRPKVWVISWIMMLISRRSDGAMQVTILS